jgi:two-component system CheB/CheR fusion protein
MNNMLSGTGVGTLFVDQQLLIRRFSPKVTSIINLIPADVGRPLSDISQRVVGDTNLVEIASAVLDTLRTIEVQLEADSGRVFRMHAQPYRTIENLIEGAVFTFVDVTDQQRLQAELDKASAAAARAGAFAQSILDTMLEPQLVLDGDLRVVTANRSFLTSVDLAGEAVVGQQLSAIDSGAWKSRELAGWLKEVLRTTEPLGDRSMELTAGARGPSTVRVNALELPETSEHRRLILLTITFSKEVA